MFSFVTTHRYYKLILKIELFKQKKYILIKLY